MNLIEMEFYWEIERERGTERAMPGYSFSPLGSTLEGFLESFSGLETLGDFLGCLSCLGSVTGRESWERREGERL